MHITNILKSLQLQETKMKNNEPGPSSQKVWEQSFDNREFTFPPFVLHDQGLWLELNRPDLFHCNADWIYSFYCVSSIWQPCLILSINY